VSVVPAFADVTVGQELPERHFRITRDQLVHYCGASGDFNVIHWNERRATAVGLPNVIAHGMCTMATTGRIVSDWVGDPTRIVEYGVRFSAPVPVPDDDLGALVTTTATISELSAEERRAKVEISARLGETDVITRAYAVVKLD
jgi:acyl dehydratase